MSRTVAKISRREKWKCYIEKNRKGNWYFLKKDAKEIAFRIIRFVQWLDMDLQDLNSRLRSSGFCV